ncbi:MAG: hypothetical protein QF819_04735 [Gemmatimonadota bacterium]|jgi:hypothetical protein|nr:hypothetical protein [Gemmatimonadota bacterium]MDP6461848.1 hypothetical protein [Gemmatimonadota bacterium]MDP6529678.1 hypothetical protein [Gemmatimonadota bacterium]MDP6802465.1 hypothetical protein [Gemmatimonadota bacterium]MDP7030979.1 hypothetical protein [Gemmatimonadota bacterium]
MTAGSHADPRTLAAAPVCFHQAWAATPPGEGLADALCASPLFRAVRIGRGMRAEWIRWSAEEEPARTPLGLVTLWPRGILLDTVSEDRMQVLRRRVESLGSGKTVADATRIVPLAEALRRPGALLHPLEDEGDAYLDAAHFARRFLKEAWVYLPHKDLAGRTPHESAHSVRRRPMLEEAIENLPRDFRAMDCGLPRPDVEEIHRLLLTEPGESQGAGRTGADTRASTHPETRR